MQLGDYKLVYQGGANKILRKSTGQLLRVSKTNTDPQIIYDFMDKYRSQLPWLIPVHVIDDPVLGRCLQMQEISTVFEFKPKWLSKPENLPKGALSCRTCAITQLRGKPLKWCALDLAVLDDDCLNNILYTCPIEHKNGVRNAIKHSGVIEALKRLQLEEPNLEVRMSFRDVTILIDKEYRCFVIDLDPKCNFAKWAEIEQSLHSYYLTKSICRLSKSP